MYTDSKRTAEKQSGVEYFTVLFWQDFVKLDDTVLPVGQCTTDLLNIEPEVLTELRRLFVEFAELFGSKIANPNIKKDLILVTAAQDKMNKVWDIAYMLPPYCYMKMPKDKTRKLLITAFTQMPDAFERIAIQMSSERRMIGELLYKLESLYPDAASFMTYITVLLDFYYERLKKRDTQSYAVGLYDLLSDTAMMNNISASLPPHPDMQFKQTSAVNIEFAPMPDPNDVAKYVLAERLVFESLGDFLRADFFRGIAQGNAPRRCHNCGRYFLLTSGYDVCYCTAVAPGETTRTCRMVGAHKKEQRREGKTPAQLEYYKVYNRLKTRKSRGKISVDEWNAAVALAQDLRDAADRGEVSEFELKRRFEGM